MAISYCSLLRRYRKNKATFQQSHLPASAPACHPAPAGARAWVRPARPALAHAWPGRGTLPPTPVQLARAGGRWQAEGGAAANAMRAAEEETANVAFKR
jgi:hypothetical protein